jgi:hypothetical protein
VSALFFWGEDSNPFVFVFVFVVVVGEGLEHVEGILDQVWQDLSRRFHLGDVVNALAGGLGHHVLALVVQRTLDVVRGKQRRSALPADTSPVRHGTTRFILKRVGPSPLDFIAKLAALAWPAAQEAPR